MGKFDTSKIEKWESMTEAEKLAALLASDIPDAVDLSKYVSKDTADKYASEAADWKKKYNSKLTEDEQKKAADDEARAELEKKYNELVQKNAITEYKAQYLKNGYDEESAGKMAEAQAAGDTATMFALMTAHTASMTEKIKKQLLEDTPKPGGTNGKPDEAKTPAIELAEKFVANEKAAGKSAIDAQKHYFG